MQFSVSASCPICRTSVVDATDPGFHACQVEVPTCSACRESGIVSATVRRTDFMALVAEASPSTVWQHRDGLVVFS